MRTIASLVLAASLVGPGVIPQKVRPTEASQPVSRSWIVFATDIVRRTKPTPPAQARLYAYVSTTYADVLSATKSSSEASEATRLVLEAVVPSEQRAIRATATALHARPLSKRGQAVADRFLARAAADGFRPDDPTQDMNAAPVGIGKWVRRDAGPLAPSAGGWQRWALPSDFSANVPRPLAPTDGEAYEAQIQSVREASARRDAAWQAVIDFWGGAPGTEGPAGIWLNRLWTRLQGNKIERNDLAFAMAQKALAQTLADAFMECWKVKFQYWTERPDMAVSGLTTAMKNPPFPSYVSGHSTVSAAAATVLGRLFPTQAASFMGDAEQARDSRLYAAIHFPMDNDEGFALGKRVGAAEISAMRL